MGTKKVPPNTRRTLQKVQRTSSFGSSDESDEISVLDDTAVNSSPRHCSRREDLGSTTVPQHSSDPSHPEEGVVQYGDWSGVQTWRPGKRKHQARQGTQSPHAQSKKSAHPRCGRTRLMFDDE